LVRIRLVRTRLRRLQRGVELLLLVEVESEYGVQAIEGSTQISDVRRLRTARG
jgi:hypothetical protein